MRIRTVLLGATSLLILAATGYTQVAVPIRPLGPVRATSQPTFAAITNIRALSDGRVLVNDATGRRVTLLDANLANATTVLDSIAGAANSYSAGNGGLLAYRADTTLMVDLASLAIVAIDPTGKIARVTPLSAPNRSAYTSMVTSQAFSSEAAVSRSFGIVFEAVYQAPPGLGASSVTYTEGDTDVIRAYDMATGTSTMLASIGLGAGTVIHSTSTGFTSDPPRFRAWPFRAHDDWAVMTDGSIAVVRGADYHVDWINTDGTHSASPPVAHAWKYYSAADKVRIADSINAVAAPKDSATIRSWRRDSAAVANGKGDSVQAARRASAEADWGKDRFKARMLELIAKGPEPRPTFDPALEPSEIPDTLPALSLFGGTVRADADNELWIPARQPSPVRTGTIYDIVNRQGKLIDRREVPLNAAIAGFGPGGVVYLTVGDDGAKKLERLTWK